MSPPPVINLASKLERLADHWKPAIIARMNGSHFKLAKIHGELVWHGHDDTDVAFIVLDGSMQLEFRGGSVDLAQGEMIVVPRGVEHRTVAGSECSILLVEAASTLNTGGTGGR